MKTRSRQTGCHRATAVRCVILLVTLIASGPAGAGAQAPASQDDGGIQKIQLTAGRSTVLGTDFDIVRIAVTNPVRVPDKPELPIFAEAVPGYDSRGWFGYVAPAATPREIVVKLNEEINRAMKQPDVAEKMVAAGLIIVTEPPEFFGDMIKSDYAKYGKLARDIGFQPQ